ncbi:MAG TPA: response regulator transcription factor [Nitrolancea sp.]|nr:response regulator transcription factor [Nitrolancea sp.]
MRILVVEDNRRLSVGLKRCLEAEGYAVDCAYDGTEGLDYAEAAPYDAIVLDLMLPGRDGVEVCRVLRLRGYAAPILMLTARDAVEDRVRGLDSGADDYLVKPFALEELHARLRALLRRQLPQRGGSIVLGDLEVDPATHGVARAGRPVVLTAREFALLELFVRHPNQIITREMAESHIWSYDYEGTSNVVDVYVRRLRRKLDDPFAHRLIVTVRGVGYRLCAPVQGTGTDAER